MREPTADALLARLAKEQSEERAPSIVAGLVRDGALVWSAGRGRVDGERPDANVQYRIGSITKTFVGVAVMRLRDEGLVDLSDRLEQHLPGHAIGGVTVAALLSHASGLRAETAPPWWERTPGRDVAGLSESTLGAGALHWREGRRFHYTNVGFGVLGELVAHLRGRPWDAVVHDEILRPLGMSRTTTRPQPPHAQGLAVHPYADVVLPEPEHDAVAMAPAGQLWSTVTDLARWAAFLAGDTGGVLARSTLEEMCEPLAVEDVRDAPWTEAYGLGLSVWNDAEGRRRVGHGGSMPGFRAGVRVDVASGDGVVTMANSTATTGPALGIDLLNILAEREPRLPDEWTPAPVDPDALGLTGTWYWGPAPYVLRVLRDGRVELAREGEWPGERFAPNGDGTYTGLEGYHHGELLQPVRGASGAAVRLEVASWAFTRTPYDAAADVPGGVDPAGWRA